MSSPEQAHFLWSLHNNSTGTRLNNLSLRELQCLGAVLPKESLKSLLVWKPGMKDWQNFTAFPELSKYHELTVSLEPPIIETPVAEITAAGEKPLDTLVVRSVEDELKSIDFRREMPLRILDLGVESDEEAKSQRRYKRYKKTFRVEFERKGKTFVSETTNISAGGMMVTEPLPEWIYGYFTVKIFDEKNDRTMTHLCWAIEDQNKLKRMHIAFLPFESTEIADKFDHWLKAS